MKPYQQGTDEEFIARMRARRLFGRAEIMDFESRVAISEFVANRHRLQMQKVEPEA